VSISNCSVLTTNATTPVTVGSPINDKATLSGATTNAGGSITFKLHSSLADCNANTNVLFTNTKTVSGIGVYTSDNYTLANVGSYYWLASYSGDANNAPSAGKCGDANESSVVGKAPSKLDTAQSFYPNDTATLSADAGGTPTGSVTFTLFDNSDCEGTAVIPATSRPLNNGVASTDNTTVAVSTSGTYYWKVEYTGDLKHKPVSSCTENTAMTINNGEQFISQ
jgi:hypothetical protein